MAGSSRKALHRTKTTKVIPGCAGDAINFGHEFNVRLSNTLCLQQLVVFRRYCRTHPHKFELLHLFSKALLLTMNDTRISVVPAAMHTRDLPPLPVPSALRTGSLWLKTQDGSSCVPVKNFEA